MLLDKVGLKYMYLMPDFSEDLVSPLWSYA